MSKSILTFCKTTISKLTTLSELHKCKSILIGVKGGGCNGLQYFIETTNEPPQKLEEEIIIDITWKKDIMGEGFDFNNPNARSSCGCGETFSI